MQQPFRSKLTIFARLPASGGAAEKMVDDPSFYLESRDGLAHFGGVKKIHITPYQSLIARLWQSLEEDLEDEVWNSLTDEEKATLVESVDVESVSELIKSGLKELQREDRRQEGK